MVTAAPKPPTKIAEATQILPIVLKLRPIIQLTEEQFAQFCSLNRDLRIELTTTGELEIMSPTNRQTGSRNITLTTQLQIWSETDASGIALDSSTGFTLPNGAVRSPDASWILKSRMAELPPERLRGFAHICPDFVAELRSESDSLATLQEKMEEYIDNGARLGLLIDPQNTRVYLYRPGEAVELLQDPDNVACDPVLRGFTLALRPIWDQPDWLPAETQE